MMCKDCFISYSGHREPEDALRLVGQLTGQGYQVKIAGAETLLDLGYLGAYARAGQKYILTNGDILSEDPSIFKKLHEHGIEEVRISSHFGIQQQIESVSEETVMKAIHEAKAHGLKVGIETTVCHENCGNGLSMCRRAYELGASRIEFLRYVKSGRAKTSDMETLGDIERELFSNSIKSAKSVYNKNDLEIKLHGNFGPMNGTRGKELARCNEYCPGGKNFFAISPDNNVYSCPFLMEHPIGKLTESGIRIERDLCFGKRDRCITDYLL
jgi:MoaA/NifB/PqqE/SkfB family radical SAM enzyme